MHFSKSLFICAFLGATAVIFGAFGAHALRESLTLRGSTGVWNTAVLYHLVHAVACLSGTLAVAAEIPSLQVRWARRAILCWATGVLLFSGSLYALALGAPKFLGPVAPLGGLALIAGWVCMGLSAPNASPSARTR